MKFRANALFSSARAAVFATITLSSLGQAADQIWIDANDNNDWNTSEPNWDGGVAWTQGSHAIFEGFADTVTLTESINAGGLTFNASGYTITGSTLTLASGAVINTDVNSATINSTLAGGPIIKSGDGILNLGGTNTAYTGAVTVNAGTLQLNTGEALGASNAITIGANGGAANPTLTIGIGGVTHSLGAITVPANVTGAAISMPQNSGTASHTIAGANLGSPLNCNQSNASYPNWTQVTWSAPITGTGGGSGNDTLVFHNTSGMQNYFTMAADQVNTFSGNVHLNGGLILVQSGSPGNDYMIPNSSMLWIEAGAWTWNHGGFVETIDGLRGAGAIGNPQFCTLTINANNTSNDANRSFSGNLGNMAGALTLGGTGTQEFSGANVNYTNATNVNNGTLKLTNTTAWGSAIALGASNSPKVQLNSPLAADAWNFGKVITGGSASASVAKAGAGSVTLTSSQTYTGSTNVNAGTLTIQSTASYPTSMPSISGMKVWLDAADPDGNSVADTADGASVATWVNKGTLGATANFTASAVGTNNPTYKASVAAFNNKPTINFVSTDKMLANTVDFTNTVSVIYVGRIGATKQRLVSSSGTTNWILGYWNGNMGANYWNGGSLGSTADTNPYIWINGATGGANAKGYRFDAAGEIALGDGTGGAGPTTGLTLGGGWSLNTPSPTERSDGDIAELFVFDHQLTTTERQQIEGYLYNKYYGTPFAPAMITLPAASPVAVANGATFGGFGGAGATTVAAGGTIQAGSAGTGALNLSSLTFSGAGTVVGTPTPTAAPLVVSGALTTAGANSVTVAVPNNLAVGTHHAIQYGSLSGSLSSFKFPAPTRNMVLQNNPPYIDVAVSAASAYPIWTGGSSGAWSYAAGSGNWKLSTTSAATDFMSNDAVLFDDSVGSGNTNLTVATDTISPGVITFNNSSKNYTLTQSNGKDIATGSLVKTGTGSLTISGAFTYAGGSTLNGGTVSLDNAGGLGSGGRSFNGGTLEYTGASGTIAGTTTINSGGAIIRVTDPAATLTQGGALSTSGSGPLTKQGDGAFILKLGTGSYSNAITINGGTLGLDYGTNGAVLTGNITGSSSGVLRLDGAGANATSGLTLTGNNTFSGETQIFTGRRIFLDSPVGNAISGDLVVKQGQYPIHGVSLLRDEQIANTSVLRFEGLSDRYDFRLNGHTETLAGIVCANGQARIANAGNDGGPDTGAPAGTLIVSGAGDYLFNGNLLDQNAGTNGPLGFTKNGPGTQTLTGTQAFTGIVYTGPTTVNSGTLELLDTTGFASPVTVNGGTFKLNRSSGTWTLGVPISGAGGLEKTGFGEVILSGDKTYTGTTTITEGTLGIAGSIASPTIDVQYSGTLGSTTVASGKTVQGNGTLSSVTFGSGSTLQPGTPTSIDTMSASGTITFAPGSTCVMQVDRTAGSITNDQLTGMNAVTYGGTLTVTATGQPFVSGDQIYLFPGASSYGGSFTTINLPTLSAGLSWDLSGLSSTASPGFIQVVNYTATPIFNPPAGGYAGAQSVSISSDSGSTIYYTMDGSTPTTSSPSHLSPVIGLSVPSNSTVTIKAFAKKTGQADSPIATSVYTTLDTPTWITDFNGSWQDTLNWQSGVVAQGIGVTADFSTLTTTALNTVYLDGPRTVGSLIFGDQGDTYGWALNAGSGGSLTLNNGANPPVVAVINQSTKISAPVTSSNGLRKEGAGALSLEASNTISGPVTVAGGVLNLENASALANDSSITLGSTGANNPALILNFAGGKTFGALTIPAGVTGARFSMPQNSFTSSHTIAGATLGSPLTVAQSNASYPNWSQITWTSKLTGNGGGSGNDTLVFSNTGTMQNYFTMGANVTNDFTGNVRVTTGLISVQSGSADSNFMIPDASMLILETSGSEWRWNHDGFIETIDGLAGAGTMGNPGNATLTIDASNANNHGDRTFSGSLGTMAGVFTKNGPGTQTFSGTGINYTNATTINAGTLELSETTSFASSAVTVNGGTLLVNNSTGTGTGSTATIAVNAGGTLSGAGSVGGATTIATGATVAPGNSTGTLTVGNVNLSGTYQCQLDTNSGDCLAVTGTLSVNPGAAITVSTLGAPTAASYTILSYGTLPNALPTITPPSGYQVVHDTTAKQVKLVSTAAGYASWAASFPGLTDTTPNGDPDKDGVSNLMEYVIGGDPRVSSTQFLPTQAIVGSNIVISYKRSDASETDTTQVGQWSTNLGTWTNVPPVLVNEHGSDPDDMSITIPLSNAINGKLFGRLKVTQP